MGVSDKKLAKRVKLIDEAYKLFLEKGVNITAIDDVVKAAGVAKGTFYLYFKDKYDLLDQIVLSKSEGVIRKAITELKEKRSTIEMNIAEQFIFFTDRIIDYMEENRELSALIHKNLSACFDILMSGDNSALKNEMKTVTDLLMETGLTEREAYIHLYMFTGMIGSACFDAIVKGQPFAIDELKPQIHMMINKLVKGDAVI